MVAEKPLFPFIAHGSAFEKPGIPATASDVWYNGLFTAAGAVDPPGVEELSNQFAVLDLTTGPGDASNVYFSYTFFLRKRGYTVVKVDEWIEVSATHREYFERSLANKEALAGTIKTGLASAAAAIADYELVRHDIRKYKEILKYFEEYEKAKALTDKNAREDGMKKAEHSLKAMFVDNVDAFTGEGISMRSIAPRWPTLIADFMGLKEEYDTVPKIQNSMGITRAEAVILKTKNNLYLEWKRMFGEAVKERYENMNTLAIARKRSIDEYREWIKPHIARFRMMKVGADRPNIRKALLKSFAEVTGQATFSNKIYLWSWVKFKIPEAHKPVSEGEKGFIIHPYDNFIKDLILNEKYGLANKDYYPWLRNPVPFCKNCKKYQPSETQVCEECKSAASVINKTVADQIVETEILPLWNKNEMSLDRNELYYLFVETEVTRLGVRTQSGELENIIFEPKNWVVSQNIILLKILELICRERELDRYVDSMVGLRTGEGKGVSEIVKEEFPMIFGKKIPAAPTELQAFAKDWGDTMGKIGGYLKYPLKFLTHAGKTFTLVKTGPYETILKERQIKQYFVPAGEKYGEITRFLKGKFGIF
ncbi:MAG: hypothetical protein HY362_00430 [Candidatus Aenigmarchaeota archaeon]|nr:hypothetical protein [Candidatus Aenigmarchaeota archaeon]